jgi:hypothetical protein
MKIDNGTGGSRETSTGKPARVDERGRESINFFAELKHRNVYKVAVVYANPEPFPTSAFGVGRSVFDVCLLRASYLISVHNRALRLRELLNPTV